MTEQKFDITDRFLRARQEDPELFNEDSFKTVRIATGVQAIIGRLKGSENTSIQSILFDRNEFDEEKAQQWLNKHKTKMNRALEIEQEKADLFSETSEDVFYEHLEGHLPPLSKNQISRLLDMLGLDNNKEFEYQIEGYGRLIR